VVTLSSIGLPGTNGFVGEFLILAGTWLGRMPRTQILAAVGATGVILGAVYMLWLVERVFFGTIRKEENRLLPDLSLRESLVLAPMVLAIVVMGLAPQPFLAPAKPAVDRLVVRMQEADRRLRARDPSRPPTVGTEVPALASGSQAPAGALAARPPAGGND
jgi:NADH-quinone oxidoreductase subunit M